MTDETSEPGELIEIPVLGPESLDWRGFADVLGKATFESALVMDHEYLLLEYEGRTRRYASPFTDAADLASLREALEAAVGPAWTFYWAPDGRRWRYFALETNRDRLPAIGIRRHHLPVEDETAA